MAESVKVELDKRKCKTNSHYPLKLLVVVNRISLRLPLGQSLLEKDWNSKLQCVKPTCTDFDSITRFNNWLLKEKSKVLSKLIFLKDEGVLDNLSIMDIKSRLLDTNTELLALSYLRNTIQELEKAKHFGNAKVYNTVYRSISNFVNGKDFPLKQISFIWLKKYEAWYLSKGNGINGLSVNLRTLRALMNLAIKQKKLSSTNYPFKEYSIKGQETRKRAISREDLIKILQFQPQTQRQTRAKDYFLISFYLMGASFVDIAMLKIKNIIQDRIEYKRQKTGKLHSIPLSKPLFEIIDKYRGGKSENDFILNVVKSVDPKIQLKQISDDLRRYNKSLKEIGKICEIESSISSYVARHSYATSAKKLGVPISVISESLGHTTEKTTQIYLDSFENDVVDKYHEMIIDLPQK